MPPKQREGREAAAADAGIEKEGHMGCSMRKCSVRQQRTRRANAPLVRSGLPRRSRHAARPRPSNRQLARDRLDNLWALPSLWHLQATKLQERMRQVREGRDKGRRRNPRRNPAPCNPVRRYRANALQAPQTHLCAVRSGWKPSPSHLRDSRTCSSPQNAHAHACDRRQHAARRPGSLRQGAAK